jgi:hypothetical protein
VRKGRDLGPQGGALLRSSSGDKVAQFLFILFSSRPRNSQMEIYVPAATLAKLNAKSSLSENPPTPPKPKALGAALGEGHFEELLRCEHVEIR